jgi:hypothetical protein
MERGVGATDVRAFRLRRRGSVESENATQPSRWDPSAVAFNGDQLPAVSQLSAQNDDRLRCHLSVAVKLIEYRSTHIHHAASSPRQWFDATSVRFGTDQGLP